jgi:hypothetical protein
MIFLSSNQDPKSVHVGRIKPAVPVDLKGNVLMAVRNTFAQIVRVKVFVNIIGGDLIVEIVEDQISAYTIVRNLSAKTATEWEFANTVKSSLNAENAEDQFSVNIIVRRPIARTVMESVFANIIEGDVDVGNAEE